jgi:outer membrane protein TolC
MLYQIYKLLLILSISFSSILASEILSTTQNEILNLSSQKNQEDASKLKKDWINPINYSFVYLKDENKDASKKSVISINQPIFRSGGLYYAIKYAYNLQDVSNISIAIQKKELIAKTLTTVYNIQKLDLQIKKQKLLILNNKIDLKIKKESVFNGLLSITFLNNALIGLNKTKLTLINLEFSKQNLINTLSTLSDLKYYEIKLPKLQITSKENFLKNNMSLNQDKLSLQTKEYLKSITNAKYLPSVNVTYNQTVAHTNAVDNYNYGFNISIPLNLTAYNDMQSSKLEVLKQQKQNKLNQVSQDLFIQTRLLSLSNIKKKMLLTKQNIHSYKELLLQTQELSDVGLKTFDDIVILENSLKNEKLDINIYEIDEQIELLEIYKRMYSDKI